MKNVKLFNRISESKDEDTDKLHNFKILIKIIILTNSKFHNFAIQYDFII